MFSEPPSPRKIAMTVLGFLVALTVHEYAHARAALAAGDDTAKRAGRVSLNPIDHLDPMGTIFFAIMMMSGLGIGYGKPVPVNPYNFKHPRWDNLKVSLWGPTSNVITATVISILLRIFGNQIPISWAEPIFYVILINLTIAFFNLIPIPPLDGSHILSALLPADLARRYELALGKRGFMIILAFVLLGRYYPALSLGNIIDPPIRLFLRLLLG